MSNEQILRLEKKLDSILIRQEGIKINAQFNFFILLAACYLMMSFFHPLAFLFSGICIFISLFIGTNEKNAINRLKKKLKRER